MNYAALLTSRAFLSQVVLTAFAVGGFYAAQTVSPFILMGRLGLSSPTFGLLTASLMASYLAGSLATNRLLRYVAVPETRPDRRAVRPRRFARAGDRAAVPVWRCRGHRADVPVAVRHGVHHAGGDDERATLFPKNAGSASALMGSLQMAMGFVGTAASALFADAVTAMAIVPPVMGVLAVLAYLAANRRPLSGP